MSDEHLQFTARSVRYQYMEFNLQTAREYAQAGKTEDWIQAYLAAGEWANPGLSNGLKLAKRWWVGPVEIPLNRLVRKCGPEPEMKYRMTPEEWDVRTGYIASTATDTALLPPVIAEWKDGSLILADGNHRHEGARRKNWQSLWAFVWFNNQAEWRSSEWYVQSNHPKLRPVIEIYEETATFWTNVRDQRSFPEKKFMDWVLSQLSLGDELLDLGCGSGYPIAEYFLSQGIKVTGVDAAAAMIKIAEERFPQATWQVADMRTLSLNRKFAAIVAWDSFFHLNFTEQEGMFPIFKAHLLNKGVLVFTSGPERGEAIGDMNGNPLFHASLSPSEYRSLLENNGLEAVEFHPQDKSCADRTTWLCRVVT